MKRSIRLLLIFGWALMLRVPIAHIPLDRDEGEYAYIAQRSLQGEIPYKTSFDQKPPGVFLIYALIERFIGRSPPAIHWGTQLYTLGTLAVVYFLGEKLFSGSVGTLAAFLLALMLADPSFGGNASNTEIFMILPLTGALYTTLVADENASLLWALATGLLLGISCLFKQVALTNGVFIALYLGIKNPKRYALLLSVLIGTGIIFSMTALCFLMAGAWQAFYDGVIGYNLNYASSMLLVNYPTLFWYSFYPQLKTFGIVYVLAALGIASYVRHQKAVQILSAWLLCSFAGVFVGGYFRDHYFIQILPAVALLTTGSLVLWAQQRWPRHFLFVSAFVVALMMAWAGWRGAWYYGSSSPDEKARTIYGKNPFVESAPVGRYLADHSNPADPIFVFGSEPQILYYAARRSASRYIFIYPVTADPKDPDGRQLRLLLELLDHKPTFIVTVFVSASFAVPPGDFPIFKTMKNLLDQSYSLAAVVPYATSDPIQVIEGLQAQEMWKKAPFWYDGRSWCSLAIWQRKP